jgi:YggT family protein
MIVYALMSWFPIEPGSTAARFQHALASVIEPVLRPVRRIIPPVAGLDLAFLVVIIVIEVVVASLGGSFL